MLVKVPKTNLSKPGKPKSFPEAPQGTGAAGGAVGSPPGARRRGHVVIAGGEDASEGGSSPSAEGPPPCASPAGLKVRGSPGHQVAGVSPIPTCRCRSPPGLRGTLGRAHLGCQGGCPGHPGPERLLLCQRDAPPQGFGPCALGERRGRPTQGPPRLRCRPGVLRAPPQHTARQWAALGGCDQLCAGASLTRPRKTWLGRLTPGRGSRCAMLPSP